VPIFILLIYQAAQSISTLSYKEYIELVAATVYGFKNEPEKKIDRSRYTEAQLKALEASVKTKIVEHKILNLKFTRDLIEFSKNVYNFEYLMTLYSSFKQHGTLPYQGSLSDQPNKIIEVFNVIGSVVTELQIQEQKKMEKKK
jgi:hypothetical protein